MDEKYKIQFIEDGVHYKVSKHKIQSKSRGLFVGDKVTARYSDGHWYDAVILEVPGGSIYNWLQ